MFCCISSEITDQTAQVGYAICESEFSTLYHYLIILRVKLVTVVSISSHGCLSFRYRWRMFYNTKIRNYIVPDSIAAFGQHRLNKTHFVS